MKVLLVFPGYIYDSVATFEEPLGVLYLASALLKAGHNVEVLDLTFDQNHDRLKEKARWADIAGISSTTPLFGSASSLLEQIKRINPGITCVIGGPHATAFPSDALRPGFDAAVVGEGEVTLVELVETLGNDGPLDGVDGIAYMEGDDLRMTSTRAFIPDLNNIDMPARQFIDYSNYRYLGMITMRGCPYRCIYCKPVEDKLFGKKLRRRSLENVLDEVSRLISVYGDRCINFKDDTFTVNNTQWFEGLGEQLRNRGLSLTWQCSSRVDTVDLNKLRAMKKAGCRQIYFGIESGSQRILDYYKKDITVEQIKETFSLCHKVGIRACASMMLGAPIETREDLEKTYQLARTIKPFNWHVHVTTPVCGSHLFDSAKEEGRFTQGADYRDFEPTGNIYRLNLPMKLDHLTVNDIAEYRDKINKYMKFRLLRHCLVNPQLWKEIFMSRGLRTIALNFIRRHFGLFKSTVHSSRHKAISKKEESI